MSGTWAPRIAGSGLRTVRVQIQATTGSFLPTKDFNSGPSFHHFRRHLNRLVETADFRDDMDRILVAYQLALTGGVPLLFVLHMLTRWKPKNRILPWVLVPALFLGTAIGVVIIGTIMHFAN